MTYGELYDQYLDECYEDCGVPWNDIPSWVTGGRSPSELMAENDPIMHRCGFAEWIDTLSDTPPECDCGRTITDFDVCADDKVECPECKGDEFECAVCGELFPIDTENQIGNTDDDTQQIVCNTCYEEHQEEEDDD